MFCPHRSACKKASQSLPPAGGKEIQIIFCRGAPQGGLSCPFGAIHLLYLTENTYQAASVRFVRQGRTNRARGRLQFFCQKGQSPFLTVSNRCGCSVRTGFLEYQFAAIRSQGVRMPRRRSSGLPLAVRRTRRTRFPSSSFCSNRSMTSSA